MPFSQPCGLAWIASTTSIVVIASITSIAATASFTPIAAKTFYINGSRSFIDNVLLYCIIADCSSRRHASSKVIAFTTSIVAIASITSIAAISSIASITAIDENILLNISIAIEIDLVRVENRWKTFYTNGSKFFIDNTLVYYTVLAVDRLVQKYNVIKDNFE